MDILKRFKIKSRLLVIVIGSSLALVLLGLVDGAYLGAMARAAAGSPAAAGVYREALSVNLGLLVLFIVCGAGVGLVIAEGASQSQLAAKTQNSLVELSNQNKQAAHSVGTVSTSLAHKSEDLRRTLSHFKVDQAG
jgi:hypothetical protein